MSDSNQNPYEQPPTNPAVAQGAPVARPLNPNPAVKKWQVVFLIVMLVIHLVGVAIGVLGVLFAAEITAGDPGLKEWECVIIGVVYGLVSILGFAAYSVALFWRRGMGGWIYNIVLLVLSLQHCCIWPMTIPILIFWIKHKDDIVLG